MIRSGLVPWPAVALVDLANRIIDGADALAAQGYVYDAEDPDGAWTIPVEPAAELAALIASCWECRRGPASLAHHWLAVAQEKYERGLPAWACDCGALYKVVEGGFGAEEFWTTDAEDGLLGELAGKVTNQRTSGGYGPRKIKSGACPGCKVPFATTMARQEVPEGALF